MTGSIFQIVTGLELDWVKYIILNEAYLITSILDFIIFLGVDEWWIFRLDVSMEYPLERNLIYQMAVHGCSAMSKYL